MSQVNTKIAFIDPQIFEIRNWIHSSMGIWYKDNSLDILSERLKCICRFQQMNLYETP